MLRQLNHPQAACQRGYKNRLMIWIPVTLNEEVRLKKWKYGCLDTYNFLNFDSRLSRQPRPLLSIPTKVDAW